MIKRFSINFSKHLLLITALLCLHTGLQAQEAELLDRIVAVVNNDVVLHSELDRELQMLEKQARDSGQRLPDPEVLEPRVLERLIQRKVQMQRAQSLGISVDEESLNRAIASIARNNNLSLPQFRQALRQEGLDYPSFREGIREELTISRLRSREIDARISISPKDIENYLKRTASDTQEQASYNLQHILIAVPDGASSEQIRAANQRIAEIAAALNNGGDFAQLAATYSDGAKALDGGAIGWRQPGELPPLFADAIVSLKAGDTTAPLRSPNGFHLLKVVDVRNEQNQLATETLARHILIRHEDDGDNETNRQKLQAIRARILQGEDFSKVAASVSDDTNSATNGGELPWYGPGEMVPAFEQVVASLAIGQLSEPFRTDFGWHIAEPLERREFNASEENRRSAAEAALRKSRSDEEYELWLRRLRAEAYVEIRGQDDEEPGDNG